MVQEVLAFAAALAPELFHLYRKTSGNLETARSKMRSMIAEIREDEAEIDAHLEAERAREKKG
jgi:hypothetical protein